MNNINGPASNLVEHLKNSTASLVQKIEGGAYMPYCGAVWVNKTDLVTALHCVDDIELGETVKFQIYKDFDNTYPFSKNKKVYIAKVIAHGEKHQDIAILKAMDDVEHGVATIADYSPRSGQVAHHIGHPRALGWSYLRCYVSETRLFGIKKPRALFLNVVGFIWLGSSGGGIFDDQGNLMGVASAILPAPGKALFVHVDVIKSILNANKTEYHTLN